MVQVNSYLYLLHKGCALLSQGHPNVLSVYYDSFVFIKQIAPFADYVELLA